MQNLMQNNEQRSFAAAMPYLNELYRAAVRLTHNRAVAEDAIREVYFEARNAFYCCRPETNMRVWLYKILFHKFGQFPRLQKSEFKIIEGDDLLSPLVLQKLSDKEIILCLEKIPPRSREAMLLADVENLSCREISEILEIPIETAKLHICFGRKMLRNALMKFAASSHAE